MSSTSKIPKIWADKPWPLLTTPQAQGHNTKSHYAIHMATDMCHVHNFIIRGLNSIYIQSPYIRSPSDIADLLFYTKVLIFCVQAHHDGEEKYLFPGLVAYTGNPDIMAENQAQHAAFHSGLKKLKQYSETTSPNEYDSSKFRSIIDSFGGDLYQHLADEIPTILALQNIPSEVLKPLWAKAEKHINDVGSLDEMFPLAFGCIDRGFEGGKHKFPPVPIIVNFVVKYWFARKHRSAWRLNPCDMWGVPRELYFVPKGEELMVEIKKDSESSASSS